MDSTFYFCTDRGVPMAASFGTGKLGADVHDTITFYDMRFSHVRIPGSEASGQQISTYFVETLREHQAGVGLDLEGSVEAWKIDARSFEIVRDAIGMQPTAAV